MGGKNCTHRPFVPLGFEKIPNFCTPNISLASKPTHNARVLGQAHLQDSYRHSVIRPLPLSALVAGGKPCHPETPSQSSSGLEPSLPTLDSVLWLKESWMEVSKQDSMTGLYDFLGSFQNKDFFSFGVWECRKCRLYCLNGSLFPKPKTFSLFRTLSCGLPIQRPQPPRVVGSEDGNEPTTGPRR